MSESLKMRLNKSKFPSINLSQFEWMVAGFRCCQTWIWTSCHPSDHARPRIDMHPHIFATKARWRGIAQPLCPATATAHLPNVLAVSSHSYWSVNPAIGSWTSSIIVRWRSFFLKMDEHGWLPSSIFPSSKVLPTRKLRRSAGHLRHIASLDPKADLRKFAVQNGSPGGLGFKIATLTQPTYPALKIEVNPHRNIIPSDFCEAWLVPLCVLSQAAATTTSVRQVAQNQQRLKLRHHSITVHRTNRGLHRGGAASATTPGKRHQKAANQELPWDFMRFCRFLNWLTSPNLIQIVSLILGFLATCGDTCGVSIWSWPLDKRQIHRCWNSASPSWLRIFDFGFSLKFVMILVSDFGLPTHHKSPNVCMFVHFSSWCCSMSFTWLVYNQKAGPSVQPRWSLASCHRDANCARLVALMAGES